jgi:predicted transcriptional regulator
VSNGKLNFTAPQLTQVLNAISDEISLNIFVIIKNDGKNTEGLRDELNITSKQCYHRINKLVDMGLVRRKGSYYNITSFGRVIFQAQEKVAKAIENYSKLKMVDVIRGSDLTRDERTKLLDELIDDDELREIIVSRIQTDRSK